MMFIGMDVGIWQRCKSTFLFNVWLKLIICNRMNEEVKAYVNYISPTAKEHEVRGMVIATITRTIEKAWPDARVSPFGSYETKLYLPLG